MAFTFKSGDVYDFQHVGDHRFSITRNLLWTVALNLAAFFGELVYHRVPSSGTHLNVASSSLDEVCNRASNQAL